MKELKKFKELRKIYNQKNKSKEDLDNEYYIKLGEIFDKYDDDYYNDLNRELKKLNKSTMRDNKKKEIKLLLSRLIGKCEKSLLYDLIKLKLLICENELIEIYDYSNIKISIGEYIEEYTKLVESSYFHDSESVENKIPIESAIETRRIMLKKLLSTLFESNTIDYYVIDYVIVNKMFFGDNIKHNYYYKNCIEKLNKKKQYKLFN